jgi:uncharacterized membrane protein
MAKHMSKSVVVRGDVSSIYRLWTEFEKFPEFMRNIRRVQRDGDMTHWVMDGPLGKTYAWDAMITAMDEDHRIAWQSIRGDIETNGEVRFDSVSPDQTRVTVSIEYAPPGGLVGDFAARFTGDPQERLEEDVERFKEYAQRVLQAA